MKFSRKAGSTSQSINIFIQDSSQTNGAGLTGLVFNSANLIAYYTFTGANATSTAITLATLAAVNSAYSSGGFKEIDATNQKGLYRFDIPNAAIATGKGNLVTIILSGATNMAPCVLEIELTGWDNQVTTTAQGTTVPEYTRLYGATAHIRRPVAKVLGGFATSSDWTPAAGDVKVSKEGSAGANINNSTTNPSVVVMGNTAYWDYTLTATEVTAGELMVTTADANGKVLDAFSVLTYGNALAGLPNQVVDANLVQGLGTGITEPTPGSLATGFSKFFTTMLEVDRNNPTYYRFTEPALAQIPKELINGMSAVDLIGQPNFGSDTPLAGTVNGITGMTADPQGLAYDPTNQKLFVADTGNNRILCFDFTFGKINKSALYVLGQTNFTNIVANEGGTPTANSLSGPQSLTYDVANKFLWAADANNNRVLKYDLSDGLNTSHRAASIVLGQAVFTTSGFGLTSTTLHNPTGVDYDPTNNRLFIADNTNNRVLVFTAASSTTSGHAAAFVLGQANFVSAINATTQVNTRGPTAVLWDDIDQLVFVSEGISDRVTVFSGSIASNGPAALFVLGAPDFTTNGGNAANQHVTWVPGQMGWDPQRKWLYVPESNSGNSRTLIWDLSNQILNGMPALYVLGQADFISNTTNSATLTAFNGGGHFAVVTDNANERTFVATGNSGGRVLVYQLHQNLRRNVVNDFPFMTEPTGVSKVNDNMVAGIAFIHSMHVNETDETNTLKTLKNQAGSSIATAPISDDGTTAIRGKFS